MIDFPRTFPNVEPSAGAVFDGATTDLNCGHGSSLDIVDKCSIEVLFVENERHATGRIITRRDKLNFYILACYDKFPQIMVGDGTSYDVCTSTVSIKKNTLNHIVGTYDVDSVGTEAKIYVNGVLTGTANLAYNIGDLRGIDLLIGRYMTEYYDRTLQYVRLYGGVVLSATDVADLYHRRVDPLQAWRDNVMLALDLTQPPQTGGALPVWPDLSGHNNNAVAHGGVGYQRSIPRRVVA